MNPAWLKVSADDYDDVCIDHGRRTKTGYAVSGGARHPVHFLHRRIFWELNGALPEAVMHTCDNPRCINPRHLVGGTRAANNKDRAAKGRSAKSVPARRKVTQEQAEEIRRRYSRRQRNYCSAHGVKRLAADYGVDTNVIYNIVEGRTHVS